MSGSLLSAVRETTSLSDACALLATQHRIVLLAWAADCLERGLELSLGVRAEFVGGQPELSELFDDIITPARMTLTAVRAGEVEVSKRLRRPLQLSYWAIFGRHAFDLGNCPTRDSVCATIQATTRLAERTVAMCRLAHQFPADHESAAKVAQSVATGIGTECLRLDIRPGWVRERLEHHVAMVDRATQPTLK